MTQVRRLVLSCFSGNLLEWFEFATFGFLVKQISAQFFPMGDSFVSQLLTYGLFATGFIMRPVGGILCGYLGDLYGRKAGLMVSISLMAIPTFSIGLLPTYEQIGVAAPLLLLLCRLLQGVSLGGEFSGSIVYLIEHAPANRRGFFGSFADMGSSVGMILATLTVLALNTLLTPEELMSWGWRIPFLCGIVFGYIGYMIRRRLLESPEFMSLEPSKRVKNPLKKSFTDGPGKFILSITFLAINSFGYYFLIIYLPQNNGLQVPRTISTIQPLLSLIIMMPATFFGAVVSDRLGQAPVMIFGTICTFFLAIPLMYVTLEGPLSLQFTFQLLFSFALGICFGPRSSFIVQLFPPQVRYTGVSVTYNLANALFGGTAPVLAGLSVYYSELALAPGILVCVMSVISFMSIFVLNLLISHRQSVTSRSHFENTLLVDEPSGDLI